MLVPLASILLALPLASPSISPSTSPSLADDTTSLKLVSSGAMRKFGYYSPLRLNLSPDKPTAIRALPNSLKAPLFGILEISSEAKRTFHVVIDEPENAPATLLVDTNGDGDLTNDPSPKWTAREVKSKDGNTYKQYEGSFSLDVGTTDAPALISLGAYRFDKNDPSRESNKFNLLYYRDYAVEGNITLGDKSYYVMLNDNLTTGDFRGKPLPTIPAEKDSSGVQIAIDVNGNGKFDKRGEAFDIRKPFNIGGTTYELRDMARNGLSFRVARSDKQVAEIPLAPDHALGKKITPFVAKDMDGKEVNFPADFKGKIVMIDFWATWCGPCMLEVPGLVKAYEQYHDQGFEVLGVTLDSLGDREKVLKVTKDKQMPWRQIFDGKGWQADIAKLYVVDSIPATYLVDGDTGEILALSDKLRGPALDKTIADAIKRRASH